MSRLHTFLSVALTLSIRTTNCYTFSDTLEDFTHVVLQDQQQTSDVCVKTSTYCRTETYRDSSNETHMNIDCLCHYEPEEISPYLEDLMSRPCPLVPMAATQRLDYATFNSTNCFMRQQPIPASLLKALRRSKHLIIWIQDAPHFRFLLSQHNDMTDDSRPMTVAVKIINSSLSGIVKGLVSDCERLRLHAVNSNLGTVDSFAFAHYDDERSDVAVNITDCVLNKLSKNSIHLPTSGVMTMRRVRVNSIDGGAISGFGEISFKDVIIGALNTGAVNIANMTLFQMDRCRLGEVSTRAVRYQKITGNSPEENDNQYADCHFILKNSQLMSVHGASFVESCHAAQVTWDNNLIMDVVNGPLLLESDNCSIAPSSVITSSRIKCSNCSSLVLPLHSNMICPVYGKAWCSFCGDRRCSQPLTAYIGRECEYGMKKAKELTEMCDNFLQRRPRQQRLASSANIVTGWKNVQIIGLVLIGLSVLMDKMNYLNDVCYSLCLTL